MRRKALAVLLSAGCVLLATACSAAGSETAGQTEETAVEEAATAQEADSQGAEAAQDADAQRAEGAQDAESAETGAAEGEEAEASETEGAVPEEKADNNAITWYMDEEGVKSDVLGMMLRRDGEKWQQLSLSQYMYVFSDGKGYQQTFECSYYDGSLDDYIAENAGFERAMLGDCPYAYQHEDAGVTEVVFAGNGVMMTGLVHDGDRKEEESLSSYLSRVNIQSCDGFDRDCLAYFTGNGLYSPALGLSVVYREGGNQIAGQEICGSMDEENMVVSDNIIRNSWEGIEDAENAQEAVDAYVEFCTGSDYDMECTELEGTLEAQAAGYEYLGKGCAVRVGDSGFYRWLFASDAIAWKIWVDSSGETGYEPCLSAIETMQ